MIKKVKRYGIEFRYDTQKKKIYNHLTDNWVTRINKETIDNYLKTKHLNYSYNLYYTDYNYTGLKEKERVNKFLTTLIKRYSSLEYINNKKKNSSFIDMEISDVFIETSVYFSVSDLRLLLGMRYFLILKKLISLKLIKVKYRDSNGFINKANGEFVFCQQGKMNLLFIPTPKLLQAKSSKQVISLYEVKKSLTYYYKRIEENLGEYIKIFNCCWESKFVMTRLEFDKIIDKKYHNYLLSNKTGINQSEYLKRSEYQWDIIQQWNNGTREEKLEMFGHFDSFSGRLHNVYARLMPEFLIFNNQLNVELDIKNSQMVLLADLLYSKLGNNSFSDQIFSKKDVYLEVKKQFGLKSRKEAKTKMFALLFGSPYASNHQQFGNIWPDVMGEIERIKSNPNPSKELKSFYRKKGTPIKKHAELARLLQSTEVKLFREIYRELHNANISFATRHDSLVVNPKDVSIAQDIMQGVLSKHLQVPFDIKVK
ncbi:MAG: hypothetical protein N4A71_08005 [Carboxylicivirga sp.]|jgi:hypothetical protein|nr:hypothetical protein [Carboxylicivirga sp.]